MLEKTLTARFWLWYLVAIAMAFFNFNGGYLSPPKRELNATSPTSPFCTSPSQLQEVTLDQDITTLSNTMGLRSPGGPVRGRSVKEIEEQLSNLKKENFNLKLRIYFLEEKMGTNFTLDKDNIVKKNIELQIEIANLQKELQEKHELLCQAVKAMELEEEEHKKYVLSKEEELNMCQQELEDLRMQLQDSKFDSDGMSVKSDTTGFYSSRATNSGNSVHDLQEKIKVLETELHLEKENNASLQFVIGQAEALKSRYEHMQKETQAKDETIKNLREEIEQADSKLMSYTKQLKEVQDKLDSSNADNQMMFKKLQVENKRFEELMCQFTELKNKYSLAKGELEREQKKVDRMKTINALKVAELEDENQKLRMKIKELQGKLEAALVEIRKNQNLAVSKSLMQKSNDSNTDVNSLSVSNSTTSPGTSQKNTSYVQLTSSAGSSPVRSSPSSPSVPEKFDVSELEELLRGTGEPSSNDKILSHFKKLRKENSLQSQKIIQLKSEKMKACGLIKTMIETKKSDKAEIAELKAHIEELEHELESVVTQPANEETDIPLKQRVALMNIKAVKSEDEKSMAESRCEDTEIAELYKALIKELETKVEVLVATLNEKDSQMLTIRQQYDEILTSLEEKEKRIVDLEFELVSVQEDGRDVNQSLLEKSDSSSEKHSSFYRQEIETKDKEIERLTVELRKCTCYLQEIVNKELWEKNKEIEKLHSKQANCLEVMRLKKELTGKDHQLKILKEKISELGLDLSTSKLEDVDTLISPSKNIHHIKTLQEQLKSCKEERQYFKEKLKELESKDYPSIIEKFEKQNESLKSDLEKSESLRQKANEICSILNNRLEELAAFLDSLLKQKSILGFLGSHKERKLREIINTSLDLSKSFAMSMITNPDQSLVQLSNITSILNGSAFQDLTIDQRQAGDTSKEEREENQPFLSIMPENVTLTYHSHLYKSSRDSEPNSEEVISALRQQIFNLQSELQLRDNELNKLNNFRESSDKTTETDTEIKHKFSSTSTSSPRFFTYKCNTTSTTLKYQSECQSESEAWSEPDRKVSRARIGLNQTAPAILTDNRVNESTEDEGKYSSTTPTKKNCDKRLSLTDLHQQIAAMQEEIANKTQQLKIAEEKLIILSDLELKLKDTETKLIETEAKRIQIELQVINLEKIVEEITQSKNELQESMIVKDKETENKINQLVIEKDQANEIVEELKKEASEAKKMIVNSEEKLKRMQHETSKLEEKLKTEYEQFAISRIKEEEQSFITKLKLAENKAEGKIKNLKEEYQRDYVKKSDVEAKLNEVNRLRSELNDLKTIVKSYEGTMQSYKDKEEEIKRRYQEYQEKNNSLRKELDNVTLQYSESVLDKTKLTNEKALLEQELNKNSLRNSDLKNQVGDIRTEFESVSVDYQKQLTLLKNQKSKLEMKVTELESTNAELHNRLVRLQAGQECFNPSIPNYEPKNLPSFHRLFSDQQYSSEDNVEECSAQPFAHPAVRNLQPVDIQRHEANSSPDLGIESDHGRFSSLETQANVPRPLLQTLELTESMNNLLDGDNIALESVNCDSEHCCQRTLEIAHENTDLKRKLQSMRRALQETLSQLNLANQRKKQVEKTICKQIHKTSQVLRKAKANLDSGSESDILNKT